MKNINLKIKNIKKKKTKLYISPSFKKNRRKYLSVPKKALVIKKANRVLKKMVFNLCRSRYIKPQTKNILKSWSIEILKKKSFLRKNNRRMQKRMRFLRHKKKSKLKLAFFQPWKKIIPPLTQKQLFVNTRYIRYRHLRYKDRIDFFRTYLGQMMLTSEMYSQSDYKNTWFSQKELGLKTDFLEDKQRIRANYDFERKQMSFWQTRFLFAQIYKKSWWYDNLVQKKQKSKSAQRFVLHRPHTAFQIHWKQQKKEPWKNALLFRRAVYSGFGEDLRKENKFRTLKIKNYLRHKNPRSEKRNQLYKRSGFLLANFRQRSRIYAKKAARIKNIVSKIIWPFYGNLRPKQMRFLSTKSRCIKSKILTSNEVLLSHLENRLDVVVYRLNLAPTILWARRLIENGSIFVTSQQNANLWQFMYASIKKIAFPLRLRDPKKIYSTRLWTNESTHWALFKFLGQPQKKINYLLQPGDLIQCASGNSLHQFKTKSSLWQKPLPRHVLTKKYPRFIWDASFKEIAHKSFNSWEQTSEYLNAAIFLHAPQFGDINSKDRIKESFFRWTIM